MYDARSYFQNLPPPRHLKAPKPLCRTESKTRADYLLRMMSSPELFNADAINSNTPPQKRYPYFFYCSKFHPLKMGLHVFGMVSNLYACARQGKAL